MAWPCFMVGDMDECELYLRRYVGGSEGGECQKNEMGYHNAAVPIGRGPTQWVYHHGRKSHTDPDLTGYEDDPRWPTHCVCGYAFKDEDHWQVHHDLLLRAEDGREWTMRTLPIGAMFWVPWHAPNEDHLSVVLPPGRNNLLDIWDIDGPSRNGNGWTRTGTPPNVSVTPSILTDKYHGFLQNGTLTNSLADRPL